MDEKGFLMGVLNKTLRIVPVKALRQGKVKGAGQDGSRGWITLIAGICCDGTYLPPALIFKGSGNLQTAWLREFDSNTHDCYFASTSTGWTNSELGLNWLLKIFYERTKDKVKDPRGWRILWLDGHNSHVNIRFIDEAYSRRILIAIYPPHSTHRLQPLDVSLFSPLSTRYSQNLDNWIQTTGGIFKLSQQDFFGIFWPAFTASFTPHNIHSGWEKTGLYPFQPARVLNELDKRSIDRPDSSSSGSSTFSAKE